MKRKYVFAEFATKDGDDACLAGTHGLPSISAGVTGAAASWWFATPCSCAVGKTVTHDGESTWCWKIKAILHSSCVVVLPRVIEIDVFMLWTPPCRPNGTRTGRVVVLSALSTVVTPNDCTVLVLSIQANF